MLNPPQTSDGLVPKTGNDLNHFFVLITYMHWNILDLLGLIQFVIKINFIFKFLNRVATRKNKTLHNMSMACIIFLLGEGEFAAQSVIFWTSNLGTTQKLGRNAASQAPPQGH